MTTIFERVEAALGNLDPTVPFAPAPYEGILPDLYVVYQLLPSPAVDHADNVEIAREYIMQVTIWSRGGLASIPNVDAAMTAAGFQKGPMRQLPKDPQTKHFGLATDYTCLEVNLS